jgi:FkbH-like protein
VADKFMPEKEKTMLASAPSLDWLPVDDGWRARLKTFRAGTGDTAEAWAEAVALANLRLDFTGTNALDQCVRERFHEGPPEGLGTQPVRLAILGSSTTQHLHAAIRVAALRRGIWLTIYGAEYGQYFQELSDTGSALHHFQPTAVLFALDGFELSSFVAPGMDAAAADGAQDALHARLENCWRLAREAFGCQIIQQAALDAFPAIIGENEHRLSGSRSDFLRRFNHWLREAAAPHGVDILSADHRAARDGLFNWFNPALWHRAKQEIAPAAAPLYGDLVARLIAARQGRAFKCLVLDLDNTLWGGVIGDDGLDGIVLGQGSAAGEAFLAVQDYARQQAARGIILAVCSKNDEANAREAFEKHPDMLLRLPDIGCFIANWQDKAANLRAIAQQLNIGLDSLVFLDDNPFERALVRAALPMVAVPELPDDPALYPYTLADAGYFESLAITQEDRERAGQYQRNLQRDALRETATDMDSYLRSLEMKLIWRRFDRLGLQRIVQLINKTNQFNLTTRRYTEADIQEVMEDPRALGLQLRLTDRLGDNGVIAILIGRLDAQHRLHIDTWLMSCRVLGRQVEQATLTLLVRIAAEMHATHLIGAYVPTAKNAMVRDHYQKLGFQPVIERADGSSEAELALEDFIPAATSIEIVAG